MEKSHTLGHNQNVISQVTETNNHPRFELSFWSHYFPSPDSFSKYVNRFSFLNEMLFAVMIKCCHILNCFCLDYVCVSVWIFLSTPVEDRHFCQCTFLLNMSLLASTTVLQYYYSRAHLKRNLDTAETCL
jgi:hypothetical protein